jgi:tetratricopeptide (TPR) repeat protein
VAEGLRRLRELADRHGFHPLIAIWPRFLDDRITDVHFMPQDNTQLVIERLAEIYGIASVRLSAFFQRHHRASAQPKSPRLIYSAGDELHPSPVGSQVAASALKQALVDLSRDTVAAKANVSHTEKAVAEAMAAAQTLGQAQPNYARVHNRMGTEHLKAGKLQEAQSAFQQALAADPSYAGAYNNLGITYERLGQGDAQAQFKRAIELRPDFTHAHYNLARMFMQKQQLPQAVTQLKRTLQTDPDHVGALNMLGTALGRQQKFAEAQPYLERAVKLDPNHAEARNNLGAAYVGQGKLHEALTQFEAALRINPHDAQARQVLEQVKAALGQ